MNTNEKGIKGLTKVIDDLLDRKYEIFLPYGDYSAVDLIAIKGDKTVRLQVKYRTVDKKGKIDVPFYNIIDHKRVPIDLGLIDGWAVYVPDIKEILYLSMKKLDGNSKFRFAIRVFEAKQEHPDERPSYKDFLDFDF